jgi:hypothetical protein
LMVVSNFSDNKTLRTITYGDAGNFKCSFLHDLNGNRLVLCRKEGQ